MPVMQYFLKFLTMKLNMGESVYTDVLQREQNHFQKECDLRLPPAMD